MEDPRDPSVVAAYLGSLNCTSLPVSVSRDDLAKDHEYGEVANCFNIVSEGWRWWLH